MLRDQHLREQKIPADCFLFKYSTRCPISGRAEEEVRKLPGDVPVYWINVIEQRQLSNWIADELGVKHESPQLLRIKDGRAAKVWNHHNVRLESISEKAAD